jgi:DNA-binding beta-propeller fold protein YncE
MHPTSLFGSDAVDISTGKYLGRVSGFVGVMPTTGTPNNSISGPDGIIALPDREELYVGDGDGTVKVIDAPNLKLVATIATGAKTRADEFAYDFKKGIIAVTTPAENVAAIYFIDVKLRKIIGSLEFPNATNGVEQRQFSVPYAF